MMARIVYCKCGGVKYFVVVMISEAGRVGRQAGGQKDEPHLTSPHIASGTDRPTSLAR